MKELILLLLSKHKNNSASNTSSTGLLSPETHSVAKEVVMQHSGKDAPVPVFLKLFVTSNSKLSFSKLSNFSVAFLCVVFSQTQILHDLQIVSFCFDLRLTLRPNFFRDKLVKKQYSLSFIGSVDSVLRRILREKYRKRKRESQTESESQ